MLAAKMPPTSLARACRGRMRRGGVTCGPIAARRMVSHGFAAAFGADHIKIFGLQIHHSSLPARAVKSQRNE
jgi:hypothetical protein